MRYMLCSDHNLKCQRLFVEDGIYWKDLGPVNGDAAYRIADVRARLSNYSAAYGLPDNWKEQR